MAKGILITTEGVIEHRNFNGLSDYQTAVGGLITSVHAVSGLCEGYANDEGLYLNMPLNAIASILFGQYLVGNVVIIGAPDYEGHDTDADESLLDYVGYLNSSMRMHEEFSTEASA